MITKNQILNNKNHFFAIFIISILPVVAIVGSGLINLSVVLLDLIFVYELFKSKNIKYLDNKFFYSLIGFWLILILSLFFSIDVESSLGRSFGFVRFIFFVFAIRYFFNLNDTYTKKIILNIWTITFFIISVDLIYEYIVGVNMLGFKSPMHGRLSGFLNQELKIGGLFLGFVGIVIANILLYLKSKKKLSSYYFSIIFLLFLSFFFTISYIIGERSNFLKVAFLLILFLFLYENKNYFKKIVFIFVSIIIVYFATISNDLLKYRFWTVFMKPLINSPSELILNSQYGWLYKGAIRVYKNHKLYGVGLKNYRLEIHKKEYIGRSNHPHQYHFEILAELGSIGYLSFVIFFVFNFYYSIKSYLRKNDLIKLSAILFIFVSLIPLLPSGSFFTTYGAALFWINFGIMLPKDN